MFFKKILFIVSLVLVVLGLTACEDLIGSNGATYDVEIYEISQASFEFLNDEENDLPYAEDCLDYIKDQSGTSRQSKWEGTLNEISNYLKRMGFCDEFVDECIEDVKNNGGVSVWYHETELPEYGFIYVTE